MSNGKGTALAELRARTALRDAGLEPGVPLERASSVTNDVWLTPTHVVRVNRTHSARLAREAMVAGVLPPAVGYPPVVGHGGRPGDDWIVVERMPGTPLAHHWPDLTTDERRSAVRQLATRLAALHATQAPANLPAVPGAPHLLEVGAFDPTGPLLAALDEAVDLPHVDRLVMQEAIDLVGRLGPVLEPFTASTLVHGDVTFENVLWHDGEVTALLDVEWARPGPRDLDLDILLRCCAFPQLHVAERFEARTRAEDYVRVPHWLSEDYPGLFAFSRELDRLRLYAIAYEVRELLAYPPSASLGALPPLHAYNRLAAVVRGRSYLDRWFARRRPARDPGAG